MFAENICHHAMCIVYTQKVVGARKGSKGIDPSKKSRLAADPKRGFGIQPNITPKRSALLAQTKAAVEQASLNGTWVDIKTGAVLLRLSQGDRPRVIRNTNDIVKLVPSFQPSEFMFCVPESEKFCAFKCNVTMQDDENDKPC